MSKALILSFLLIFSSLQAHIITIPKAGFHIFVLTLNELEIYEPAGHFMEDTAESRKALEIAIERDLFPSDWLNPIEYFYTNPNIFIIRDLRDVFCSAEKWLVKAALADLSHKNKDQRKCALAYLKLSPDERLKSALLGRGHSSMLNTHVFQVCQLLFRLISSNQCPIFISKFENFFSLEDKMEQVSHISNLCSFLNEPRSATEIEAALHKVWGHSMTYTPTKKKVGQWKERFTDEHIELFRQHWDELNQQLGYPSIDDEL
ncbi:MAG: hypothetical protein K0U13_01640 [Chlamydiae bacterium]|nr:hypothetical protein [Chlamydiales bacterium]MCH9703472.1 hypothetical protein [Chlamydiota bacterium]